MRPTGIPGERVYVGRLTSETKIRGIRRGEVYWFEIAHDCVLWLCPENLDEISCSIKEGKSLLQPSQRPINFSSITLSQGVRFADKYKEIYSNLKSFLQLNWCFVKIVIYDTQFEKFRVILEIRYVRYVKV